MWQQPRALPSWRPCQRFRHENQVSGELWACLCHRVGCCTSFSWSADDCGLCRRCGRRSSTLWRADQVAGRESSRRCASPIKLRLLRCQLPQPSTRLTRPMWCDSRSWTRSSLRCTSLMWPPSTRLHVWFMVKGAKTFKRLCRERPTLIQFGSLWWNSLMAELRSWTMMDGTEPRTSKTAWTGATVFQINGEARKEICMFSCHYAKKMGQEVKTQMMRQQRKKDKKSESERDLSVHERALFQASWSMMSELLTQQPLQFQNVPCLFSCWLGARTLMVLHALQGNLDTSSPTTSRLSRNFLLSMTSTLEWLLWTADISTAFLQGLPQERKAVDQVNCRMSQAAGLWAWNSNVVEEALLRTAGCTPQVASWSLIEACRHLRGLGLRLHVLDPCTFLILEKTLVLLSFPKVQSENVV